jgi:hypothetical protein
MNFLTILTNYLVYKTSDFHKNYLLLMYFDEVSSNFIFAQKSDTLKIILLKK